MTPQPKFHLTLEAHAIAETRMRARQIGKALHVAFEEVTREPVPSEFLELFRQLDERERLSLAANKRDD